MDIRVKQKPWYIGAQLEYQAVIGNIVFTDNIFIPAEMVHMKDKPARKRINSPFAKNLKSILEERGISQRSAANIAGVNSATINQWLSGTQPNDALAVLKLCKAFKCDFQWLLTGIKSEQSKASEIGLSEIFEIEEAPDFSGIFMIEAKRLKRRKE